MSEKNTPIAPLGRQITQNQDPEKKGIWKTVLTIIFLVLFWPLGLILTWFLAPWTRKTKIIITLVMLVVILVLFIATAILMMIAETAMQDISAHARDSYRKSDIAKIGIPQQLYLMEHGQYFTSETYPEMIGSMEMPLDPLTSNPYGWIDNTGDAQEFCAYADLESNGYFTVTHKGLFEVQKQPMHIEDCFNGLLK